MGRGWVTISLKRHVYEALKAWSGGKTMSDTVYELILLRARVSDEDALDRIAWYAVKLSMSVGEFKAKPDDTNYNMLLNTANQVRERLGVDTSELLKACLQYRVDPSRQNRIAINEALKNTVKEMLKRELLSVKPG